jgi:two-component system, NtrC family, nitrogen regulation sensor histidine kinase NtrY
MTTVEEASAVEPAQRPTSATRFATGLLGPIAVAAALLSALTTFLVLANLTFVNPTHSVVVTLLAVNFVAVLLLLTIIGREVWHIVQARRRGSAGARLHVQIAGLFSVIAVVPAVLVSVVASVNLDRGLDRLFSIRTRAVIENSVIVSQAYLNEHERSIRAETNAMAIDVGRAKPLFDQDIDRFRQFFTAQASLRNMPTAMMIRPDGSVIVKAEIQLPADLQEPPPPPAARLAEIGEAEAVAGMLRDTNCVGALIKLKGHDDAYLFVARFIDPRVLGQIQQTESSIQEYASLEARRGGVQLAFALMYTVIALTVLLSAVWIGFAFANRLVAPIRRLIGAANLVSTGNLHVQVPVRRSEGDLSQLGATFNKMTQELRTQRNDIMRARDLVDSRRRFTEAVLAGASAGVIGVDGDGHVSILNRSAEKLIGSSEVEALGHPLEEIVPELKHLIEPARLGGQRLVQGQTTIHRLGTRDVRAIRQSGPRLRGHA